MPDRILASILRCSQKKKSHETIYFICHCRPHIFQLQKESDLYLGRPNFPVFANPDPILIGYSDYYFKWNRTDTRYGVTTYRAIISNQGNVKGSQIKLELYKDCQLIRSRLVPALEPGQGYAVDGTIDVSLGHAHILHIGVPANDFREIDKNNNLINLDWFSVCPNLPKD